jgi:26 proteasome complex subunit DSS1
MSAKAANSAPATSTDTAAVKPEAQKVELGLLEEDDEFEEFEADDWNEAEKDSDVNNQEANLWEDNWDDDNVEDDFTNQLR